MIRQFYHEGKVIMKKVVIAGAVRTAIGKFYEMLKRMKEIRANV